MKKVSKKERKTPPISGVSSYLLESRTNSDNFCKYKCRKLRQKQRSLSLNPFPVKMRRHFRKSKSSSQMEAISLGPSDSCEIPPAFGTSRNSGKYRRTGSPNRRTMVNSCRLSNDDSLISLGSCISPSEDPYRSQRMKGYIRLNPVSYNERMDSIGYNERMDSVGYNESMDSIGYNRRMDSVGDNGRIDSVGYNESMDSIGYSGRMDSVGYNERMDSIGYNESMDSIGYNGRMDSVGYNGRMDSVGYNRRMDSVGDNGRMDSVGYNERMDSIGYNERMDSIGYNERMDSVGYNERMDSVGYNERMDSVGYNGRMDSVGYNGRMDSVDYNERMDSVGYNGRMDSVGYNGRMDSVGYNETKDFVGYNERMDSVRYNGRMDSLGYNERMDSVRYNGRMDSVDYNGTKDFVGYSERMDRESRDTLAGTRTTWHRQNSMQCEPYVPVEGVEVIHLLDQARQVYKSIEDNRKSEYIPARKSLVYSSNTTDYQPDQSLTKIMNDDYYCNRSACSSDTSIIIEKICENQEIKCQESAQRRYDEDMEHCKEKPLFCAKRKLKTARLGRNDEMEKIYLRSPVRLEESPESNYSDHYSKHNGSYQTRPNLISLDQNKTPNPTEGLSSEIYHQLGNAPSSWCVELDRSQNDIDTDYDTMCVSLDYSYTQSSISLQTYERELVHSQRVKPSPLKDSTVKKDQGSACGHVSPQILKEYKQIAIEILLQRKLENEKRLAKGSQREKSADATKTYCVENSTGTQDMRGKSEKKLLRSPLMRRSSDIKSRQEMISKGSNHGRSVKNPYFASKSGNLKLHGSLRDFSLGEKAKVLDSPKNSKKNLSGSTKKSPKLVSTRFRGTRESKGALPKSSTSPGRTLQSDSSLQRKSFHVSMDNPDSLPNSDKSVNFPGAKSKTEISHSDLAAGQPKSGHLDDTKSTTATKDVQTPCQVLDLIQGILKSPTARAVQALGIFQQGLDSDNDEITKWLWQDVDISVTDILRKYQDILSGDKTSSPTNCSCEIVSSRDENGKCIEAGQLDKQMFDEGEMEGKGQKPIDKENKDYHSEGTNTQVGLHGHQPRNNKSTQCCQSHVDTRETKAPVGYRDTWGKFPSKKKTNYDKKLHLPNPTLSLSWSHFVRENSLPKEDVPMPKPVSDTVGQISLTSAGGKPFRGNVPSRTYTSFPKTKSSSSLRATSVNKTVASKTILSGVDNLQTKGYAKIQRDVRSFGSLGKEQKDQHSLKQSPPQKNKQEDASNGNHGNTTVALKSHSKVIQTDDTLTKCELPSMKTYKHEATKISSSQLMPNANVQPFVKDEPCTKSQLKDFEFKDGRKFEEEITHESFSDEDFQTKGQKHLSIYEPLNIEETKKKLCESLRQKIKSKETEVSSILSKYWKTGSKAKTTNGRLAPQIEQNDIKHNEFGNVGVPNSHEIFTTIHAKNKTKSPTRFDVSVSKANSKSRIIFKKALNNYLSFRKNSYLSNQLACDQFTSKDFPLAKLPGSTDTSKDLMKSQSASHISAKIDQSDDCETETQWKDEGYSYLNFTQEREDRICEKFPRDSIPTNPVHEKDSCLLQNTSLQSLSDKTESNSRVKSEEIESSEDDITSCVRSKTVRKTCRKILQEKQLQLQQAFKSDPHRYAATYSFSPQFKDVNNRPHVDEYDFLNLKACKRINLRNSSDETHSDNKLPSSSDNNWPDYPKRNIMPRDTAAIIQRNNDVGLSETRKITGAIRLFEARTVKNVSTNKASQKKNETSSHQGLRERILDELKSKFGRLRNSKKKRDCDLKCHDNQECQEFSAKSEKFSKYQTYLNLIDEKCCLRPNCLVTESRGRKDKDVSYDVTATKRVLPNASTPATSKCRHTNICIKKYIYVEAGLSDIFAFLMNRAKFEGLTLLSPNYKFLNELDLSSTKISQSPSSSLASFNKSWPALYIIIQGLCETSNQSFLDILFKMFKNMETIQKYKEFYLGQNESLPLSNVASRIEMHNVMPLPQNCFDKTDIIKPEVSCHEGSSNIESGRSFRSNMSKGDMLQHDSSSLDPDYIEDSSSRGEGDQNIRSSTHLLMEDVKTSIKSEIVNSRTKLSNFVLSFLPQHILLIPVSGMSDQWRISEDICAGPEWNVSSSFSEINTDERDSDSKSQSEKNPELIFLGDEENTSMGDTLVLSADSTCNMDCPELTWSREKASTPTISDDLTSRLSGQEARERNQTTTACEDESFQSAQISSGWVDIEERLRHTSSGHDDSTLNSVARVKDADPNPCVQENYELTPKGRCLHAYQTLRTVDSTSLSSVPQRPRLGVLEKLCLRGHNQDDYKPNKPRHCGLFNITTPSALDESDRPIAGQKEILESVVPKERGIREGRNASERNACASELEMTPIPIAKKIDDIDHKKIDQVLQVPYEMEEISLKERILPVSKEENQREQCPRCSGVGNAEGIHGFWSRHNFLSVGKEESTSPSSDLSSVVISGSLQELSCVHGSRYHHQLKMPEFHDLIECCGICGKIPVDSLSPATSHQFSDARSFKSSLRSSTELNIGAKKDPNDEMTLGNEELFQKDNLPSAYSLNNVQDEGRSMFNESNMKEDSHPIPPSGSFDSFNDNRQPWTDTSVNKIESERRDGINENFMLGKYKENDSSKTDVTLQCNLGIYRDCSFYIDPSTCPGIPEARDEVAGSRTPEFPDPESKRDLKESEADGGNFRDNQRLDGVEKTLPSVTFPSAQPYADGDAVIAKLTPNLKCHGYHESFGVGNDSQDGDKNLYGDGTDSFCQPMERQSNAVDPTERKFPCIDYLNDVTPMLDLQSKKRVKFFTLHHDMLSERPKCHFYDDQLTGRSRKDIILFPKDVNKRLNPSLLFKSHRSMPCILNHNRRGNDQRHGSIPDIDDNNDVLKATSSDSCSDTFGDVGSLVTEIVESTSSVMRSEIPANRKSRMLNRELRLMRQRQHISSSWDESVTSEGTQTVIASCLVAALDDVLRKRRSKRKDMRRKLFYKKKTRQAKSMKYCNCPDQFLPYSRGRKTRDRKHPSSPNTRSRCRTNDTNTLFQVSSLPEDEELKSHMVYLVDEIAVEDETSADALGCMRSSQIKPTNLVIERNGTDCQKEGREAERSTSLFLTGDTLTTSKEFASPDRCPFGFGLPKAHGVDALHLENTHLESCGTDHVTGTEAQFEMHPDQVVGATECRDSSPEVWSKQQDSEAKKPEEDGFPEKTRQNRRPSFSYHSLLKSKHAFLKCSHSREKSSLSRSESDLRRQMVKKTLNNATIKQSVSSSNLLCNFVNEILFQHHCSDPTKSGNKIILEGKSVAETTVHDMHEKVEFHEKENAADFLKPEVHLCGGKIDLKANEENEKKFLASLNEYRCGHAIKNDTVLDLQNITGHSPINHANENEIQVIEGTAIKIQEEKRGPSLMQKWEMVIHDKQAKQPMVESLARKPVTEENIDQGQLLSYNRNNERSPKVNLQQLFPLKNIETSAARGSNKRDMTNEENQTILMQSREQNSSLQMANTNTSMLAERIRRKDDVAGGKTIGRSPPTGAEGIESIDLLSKNCGLTIVPDKIKRNRRGQKSPRKDIENIHQVKTADSISGNREILDKAFLFSGSVGRPHFIGDGIEYVPHGGSGEQSPINLHLESSNSPTKEESKMFNTTENAEKGLRLRRCEQRSYIKIDENVRAKDPIVLKSPKFCLLPDETRRHLEPENTKQTLQTEKPMKYSLQHQCLGSLAENQNDHTLARDCRKETPIQESKRQYPEVETLEARTQENHEISPSHEFTSKNLPQASITHVAPCRFLRSDLGSNLKVEPRQAGIQLKLTDNIAERSCPTRNSTFLSTLGKSERSVKDDPLEETAPQGIEMNRSPDTGTSLVDGRMESSELQRTISKNKNDEPCLHDIGREFLGNNSYLQDKGADGEASGYPNINLPTIGKNMQETMTQAEEKEEPVTHAEDAHETVIQAEDAHETVIQAEDAQETVIQAEDAHETVIQAQDAQETVIQAQDAQETVIQAEDAHETVIQAEDAQETVFQADDAHETVIQAEDAHETVTQAEDAHETVIPAKENTQETVTQAKESTQETVTQANENTQETVIQAKENTQETVTQAKGNTQETVTQAEDAYESAITMNKVIGEMTQENVHIKNEQRQSLADCNISLMLDCIKLMLADEVSSEPMTFERETYASDESVTPNSFRNRPIRVVPKECMTQKDQNDLTNGHFSESGVDPPDRIKIGSSLKDLTSLLSVGSLEQMKIPEDDTKKALMERCSYQERKQENFRKMEKRRKMLPSPFAQGHDDIAKLRGNKTSSQDDMALSSTHERSICHRIRGKSGRHLGPKQSRGQGALTSVNRVQQLTPPEIEQVLCHGQGEEGESHLELDRFTPDSGKNTGNLPDVRPLSEYLASTSASVVKDKELDLISRSNTGSQQLSLNDTNKRSLHCGESKMSTANAKDKLGINTISWMPQMFCGHKPTRNGHKFCMRRKRVGFKYHYHPYNMDKSRRKKNLGIRQTSSCDFYSEYLSLLQSLKANGGSGGCRNGQPLCPSGLRSIYRQSSIGNPRNCLSADANYFVEDCMSFIHADIGDGHRKIAPANWKATAIHSSQREDVVSLDRNLFSSKCFSPSGPNDHFSPSRPKGLFSLSEPNGHFSSSDSKDPFTPSEPKGYFTPSGPNSYFSPSGPNDHLSPSEPNGHFSPSKPNDHFSPSKHKGLFSPSKPKGLFSPSAPKGNFSPSAPKGHFSPSGPNGYFSPSGPNDHFSSSEPNGHFSPSKPKGLFSPSRPKGHFSPSAPEGHFSPSGPKGLFSPSGPKGLFSPSGPKGHFSPSAPKGHFSPSGPNSYFSPSEPSDHFSPSEPNSYFSPSGLKGHFSPSGPKSYYSPSGPTSYYSSSRLQSLKQDSKRMIKALSNFEADQDFAEFGGKQAGNIMPYLKTDQAYLQNLDVDFKNAEISYQNLLHQGMKNSSENHMHHRPCDLLKFPKRHKRGRPRTKSFKQGLGSNELLLPGQLSAFEPSHRNRANLRDEGVPKDAGSFSRAPISQGTPLVSDGKNVGYQSGTHQYVAGSDNFCNNKCDVTNSPKMEKEAEIGKDHGMIVQEYLVPPDQEWTRRRQKEMKMNYSNYFQKALDASVEQNNQKDPNASHLTSYDLHDHYDPPQNGQANSDPDVMMLSAGQRKAHHGKEEHQRFANPCTQSTDSLISHVERNLPMPLPVQLERAAPYEIVRDFLNKKPRPIQIPVDIYHLPPKSTSRGKSLAISGPLMNLDIPVFHHDNIVQCKNDAHMSELVQCKPDVLPQAGGMKKSQANVISERHISHKVAGGSSSSDAYFWKNHDSYRSDLVNIDGSLKPDRLIFHFTDESPGNANHCDLKTDKPLSQLPVHSDVSSSRPPAHFEQSSSRPSAHFEQSSSRPSAHFEQSSSTFVEHPHKTSSRLPTPSFRKFKQKMKKFLRLQRPKL